MPSSYPPPSHRQYRTQDRRSHSGSRTRRDVQHRPFSGYQQEQQRESAGRRLRDHFVAMLSEFVGTTMFLWFAFAGTQAASLLTPDGNMTVERLLFISFSFGISLLVVVWANYRISGGLFNPAVTLALCITKNVPWLRGLCLLPAQLLGGIVAAALVRCMIPGPVATVTLLAEGVSIAQGTFIEAFGTMLLITVILFLAAEKHETTPFAPLGIGLALFVVELGTVLFTGGAVNPARALGPSVAATTFPGYHWLYWIGPLIGALMASGYYGICRTLNYWEANPGQDSQKPQ